MPFYRERRVLSANSPSRVGRGRHPEGPRFLQRAEGSPHSAAIGFVNVLPVFREVVPTGIHRFDEFNLLAPSPTLDFFLAIDRCVWVEKES